MRHNLFNQPLGCGLSDGYALSRKEMPIPLAVPLVMAGVSALSSIFGGAKSAQANKQANEQLAKEKARTEAERMRARHQSWLDTASGQNTVRMLADQGQRELKSARGEVAVGGATEGSVAAQKELNNLRQAEVIAQANADFEDRKDQVDASYRQQLASIEQQRIVNEKQRADNIAAAASGASSALMQGALTTFGGTKIGQQWMGTGSPAGGGVTPPPQLQQMGQNFTNLRRSPLFETEYRKFFGL